MLIISKETKINDLDLLVDKVLKLPVIPVNDANSPRLENTNTLIIWQEETAIFSNNLSIEFIATEGLSNCILIVFSLPGGKTLTTHYDGALGYDWNKYLSDYNNCEIGLKLLGGLNERGLNNLKKVLLALHLLSQNYDINFNITHQRLHGSFYEESSSEIFSINNYLQAKIKDAFEYYFNAELPSDFLAKLSFSPDFHARSQENYKKLKQMTENLIYPQLVAAIKKVFPGEHCMALIKILCEAQPKKIVESKTVNEWDEAVKSVLTSPQRFQLQLQMMFADPITYSIARIFFRYVKGAARTYYSNVAVSLKTGELCVLPYCCAFNAPNSLMRTFRERAVALTQQSNFVYYDLDKGVIPEETTIPDNLKATLFKYIPHFEKPTECIPEEVCAAMAKDFLVSKEEIMPILSLFGEMYRNKRFAEFRKPPVISSQSASSSASTSSTAIRSDFFAAAQTSNPKPAHTAAPDSSDSMLVISKHTRRESLGFLLVELQMLPVIPLQDDNSNKVTTKNTLTILQQETAIFSEKESFEFVATRYVAGCIFIIFILPDKKTLIMHYDGTPGYDWDRYLFNYKNCQIHLKLMGGIEDNGLNNIEKLFNALLTVSNKKNITFIITNQRVQNFFSLQSTSKIFKVNNYLYTKIREAYQYYLGVELLEDCQGLAFQSKLQNRGETSARQLDETIGDLLMFLFEAKPKKVVGVDDLDLPDEIESGKMKIEAPGMLPKLFESYEAYQLAREIINGINETNQDYYSDVAFSLRTGEFCVLPFYQCGIGPNRLMRLLNTAALPIANHFACYDFSKDGIPENSQVSKGVRDILFKFIPYFTQGISCIPKTISDAIVSDFHLSGPAEFMFVLSVLTEISRDEKFKEFKKQLAPAVSQSAAKKAEEEVTTEDEILADTAIARPGRNQ